MSAADKAMRATRWRALALFAWVLALYLATASGRTDNPDAEVEFQTTSALVRSGSLALGGTPEAEALVSARFDVQQGAGAQSDHFYSWFGVGQALSGVPLYLAGRALALVFPELEARHAQTLEWGVPQSEYFAHLCVNLRNALLGAGTALLLWCAARRLVSERAAWVCALSYAAASFAWAQARSTLSDVQATFLLLLVFQQLLELRHAARSSLHVQRGRWLCVGLALGWAFLTRVATAPAIALLLLLTVATARPWWADRRRLLGIALLMGLPALACVVLFVATNLARFGAPFETGYSAGVGAGFFAFPAWLGMAGMLVAPGKGLLWLAPAGLLCLPCALLEAWRRGERLWICAALGLFAASAGPVCITATWHGAWTFGPRYLLPALPLLWISVAYACESRSRALRATLGLGILLGVATNLPAALTDTMTHHDLALQAAARIWPDAPGEAARDAGEARFQRIQWEWRFAAPWAHWRIFLERVRGEAGPAESESFDAQRLFGVAGPRLAAQHARSRGFGHLAWVDLHQRLGGPLWPGPLLVLLLGVAGSLCLRRAQALGPA